MVGNGPQFRPTECMEGITTIIPLIRPPLKRNVYPKVEWIENILPYIKIMPQMRAKQAFGSWKAE